MLGALKLDGTLCSFGLPDELDLSAFSLAMGRRSLASSGAGGTNITREMLELCGAHSIVADIEIVKPDQIATAFERLAAADVRYRFVLDLRHRRVHDALAERRPAAPYPHQQRGAAAFQDDRARCARV